MHAKHLREKERKKLCALISLKQSEFNTRQELADDLKIHIRTLERWLTLYKEKGLDNFLSIPVRNKPSKIISPKAHQQLAQRLADSNNPLLGYTHAKRWLKHEFGVEIKYSNLRYCIQTHFKAKLKVARKSHIKKEPKAIEAFLKTA